MPPSNTYDSFIAPIRNGGGPSFDVHIYFHQVRGYSLSTVDIEVWEN